MSRSDGDGDGDVRRSFQRRDSELSELPVGEHSLLHSNTEAAPRSDGAPSAGDTSMDEGVMRQHFMDVESSFLPDAAPPALHVPDGGRGVDDTYLELGKPGHTPPPDLAFGRARKTTRGSSVSSQPHPPPDVPASHGDRAHDRVEEAEREEEDEGEDEAGEDDMAERPVTQDGHTNSERSAATAARVSALRDPAASVASGASSRPATPPTRPISKGSTIRPGSSPAPGAVTWDTDGSSLSLNGMSGAMSPLAAGSRPPYLNNRQASQYSTASAATLSSDLSSDSAVNADYALQTGGAISGSQVLGNARAGMWPRMPSLGSSVSYAEHSDGASSLSRGVSGDIRPADLARRRNGVDQEDPETPRGGGGGTNHVQAPTDTVLAQRVESIHVPDTVAKAFRARNRSPERPASSGGPAVTFQDRPRRSLTLKEQNSKIDKLTKENFELKLKIHFLDQALQTRSDDGVKELIDKNVQLQTDLANERKEAQTFRRKVRELERTVQEQEEAMAELRQQNGTHASDREDDDPTLQAEMHEEILYLRQQLDHSENQVTTLREEVMTKELEKRKMAEHMRSMAGNRSEDTAGMKETMDMWQDLLNAETGRREQAEEDIRKLREELTALRIERASPAANKALRRRSGLGLAYEPSVADESEYTNGAAHGTPTDSSVTLIEQLKHENGELRRDLGAQTSMLTSRNRERERLQQEIEDLKLLTRKSDGARSVAGESIFERSISRAHQRVPSRNSDYTHVTQAAEAEREDWERKEGQLRDQNAELRLKYQELERSHSTHLQYVAALEGDFEQMENELNDTAEDLRALQTERDDLLHACEDKEQELKNLEEEALNEIERLTQEVNGLDEQLQEAHKKYQKAQTKLEHTTDDYKGLQGELREITQSVMNLEDEKQANVRTIQTLEQQIADAEDEIQKWEQKVKELDQKNRKLEITQESLHSEITFLREEQESDKIKIGELEDALNAAQQTIQDEQEKLREVEEGIMDERHQRDVLENQSKEEVQKVLDDLNSESAKTKDEVRKLRRGLSAKEVEASSWKQKLDELEQALRVMLGEPNGNRQTLLGEIERLQRDLENTANRLDRAKMEVADKDRLLRHRDGLLESTSLESRRLSDLLDKERASRKHDLEQFEKSSRGQASHMRELAQYQSRVLDLETAFSQDKRKMAALEQQYFDQLNERNTLLLALWNRLSTICGPDWAKSHALINGEPPSVPAIQNHLAAFNKNLITAVKTIEALMGSFKVRIRNVEKTLWRDYQTLEENLNLRCKKMDMLENAVEDAQRQIAAEAAAQAQQRPQTTRSTSMRGFKGSEEIAKLKSEVKLLKAELKFHRQHPSPMAQQLVNQHMQTSPEHARRQSSSGNSGLSQSSPGRAIAALLRHHSTSAVEQLHNAPEEPVQALAARGPPQTIALPASPTQPNEQRWIHRLKELERRLKAEREARLQDRRGARQRLEEGRLENEELRQMLERERLRRESPAEGEEERSNPVSDAVNQRDVD